LIVLGNLIAQVLIVVTGGLVRLTGSGLGCPTWPQCVPGSYVPVVEQAEGYHKYIEFGNRLLTGLVLATAIAVLVVVVGRVRAGRSRRLLVVGALPLVLVIGQALLGGVTVLLDLHPVTVAAHFLLSMGLIATSTFVLIRLTQPDGPLTPATRAEVRWLGLALAGVGVVVLVLGTVVTGSGPHSGDADTPARFGFDPRTVSWLHADAVMVFAGLAVGLVIAVRLAECPAQLRAAAVAVLVVTLVQGVLGYLQYFAGLPVGLVAAHMLGACLLTICLTLVVGHLWRRLPVQNVTAQNLRNGSSPTAMNSSVR
jgi:cytochrome c oxidase assembly protein subunit 15